MRLCLPLLLILSVVPLPAQTVQCLGQLTLDQMIILLQGKGPEDRIQEIIGECGIGFSPTDSILARLRSVGTSETILKAVKQQADLQRWEAFKKSQGLAGAETGQPQMLDAPETQAGTVAKNEAELTQLRLKGGRDYFEFTIGQKHFVTKVHDVGIILTQTDAKKGRFSIHIIYEDTRLEKKNRMINEPVLFLVGPKRLRYELVINWIQKNKAGGYLSIPRNF